MLDLTKRIEAQKNSVIINGKNYKIKTDFFYGVMFYRSVKEKRNMSEYIFLFEDEPPIKTIEDLENAFNALVDFYGKQNELPRNIEGEASEIILDYEIDADLIYSAFMECYKINLLKEKLHWYEFKALLSGLKECKLTEVISYRLYNPNDKTKYEARMQKMKNAWRIESKLSAEEKKALDNFDKLFEE